MGQVVSAEGDVDCWAQCGTFGPCEQQPGLGKPCMQREHPSCVVFFCAPCIRVVRAIRSSVAKDPPLQARLRLIRKHFPDRYKSIVRSARMSLFTLEPGLMGGDGARRLTHNDFKSLVQTVQDSQVDYEVVHMCQRRWVQWHVVNECHTQTNAEALWTQALGKVPLAIRDKDHNNEVVLHVAMSKTTNEVSGSTQLLNETETSDAMKVVGQGHASALTEGPLKATSCDAMHQMEMRGLQRLQPCRA